MQSGDPIFVVCSKCLDRKAGIFIVLTKKAPQKVAGIKI
jgi:hypothetical protein